MLVWMICGPATSWDLPVEAEQEAVCCDQPPLFVFSSGTWCTVPLLDIVALCECVIVATEADSTDSTT